MKKQCPFRHFSYGRYWYWTRPWLFIRDALTSFSEFVHRGLYGYARSDLWSLTDYFAEWMPHAMERFRTHRCGYPANMTNEEWDAILKKIRNGFRAAKILNDACSLHHKTWTPKLEAIQSEGMALFGKHYFSLWD